MSHQLSKPEGLAASSDTVHLAWGLWAGSKKPSGFPGRITGPGSPSRPGCAAAVSYRCGRAPWCPLLRSPHHSLSLARSHRRLPGASLSCYKHWSLQPWSEWELLLCKSVQK